MKKIVVAVMVVMMLVSGCAIFQKPCSPEGLSSLQTAINIRAEIQAYYGLLQGLVQFIPTAGPILAVGIPLALSAADQALNGLGTMIATGCAMDKEVTLAQIVLNQIKALFEQPEVKVAAMKRGIALP